MNTNRPTMLRKWIEYYQAEATAPAGQCHSIHILPDGRPATIRRTTTLEEFVEYWQDSLGPVEITPQMLRLGWLGITHEDGAMLVPLLRSTERD